MLTLNPETLSDREIYKLLIGSIIPRPVAVVATQSTKQILNIAPFSYFSIVSTSPTLVSVSVQRKSGVMKDTARNLLETKEAVVHILDDSNLDLANETAAPLDPETSELTRADFKTVASTTITTPGLKPAKVRFETTLYQHIPVNTDTEITADLFLLEIKAFQIDESIYHEGKIDPRQLGAISRLAGNDYANIGEITTIARPLE
ncbi:MULTISPECIES: flavin reductase family protein [Enterococcus]|uniref:Flavin reductase like domain-containing protein n=1 Tax=Enterococcus sulfureus ATCC 49903 TaxID=1140003 RepID=S0KWB7_9ENTE|nr:flavin reductase family protein [Enterococcus sulfureus]EOT45305.1 hypothetical protein OMY_02199 [Enterococcus sulfureus ATCC 49903]EOT84242.1 hypothetical protein I573_01143 [Enterococcus sulfureus ATCC 49903]